MLIHGYPLTHIWLKDSLLFVINAKKSFQSFSFNFPLLKGNNKACYLFFFLKRISVSIIIFKAFSYALFNLIVKRKANQGHTPCVREHRKEWLSDLLKVTHLDSHRVRTLQPSSSDWPPCHLPGPGQPWKHLPWWLILFSICYFLAHVFRLSEVLKLQNVKASRW